LDLRVGARARRCRRHGLGQLHRLHPVPRRPIVRPARHQRVQVRHPVTHRMVGAQVGGGPMGDATIDIRFTSVLKDFKGAERVRYHREVEAYTAMPWATPQMIVHNEFWIEMERLTPILDISYQQSVKYRDPLRKLLQRVHDAGYWHGDVA